MLDRGSRQGSEANDLGRRIRGDRREQVRLRPALTRAAGDDERDVELLEPCEEECEVAQRRSVGPVRVVDDEAERALGREVGTQPVEAVEDRERRVDTRPHAARALAPRQVQQAGGNSGGALEPVGSLGGGRLREHGLDELPHDAEREVPLELGAARAQDAHVLADGEGARGRQDGRLADARRPLDDQEAATARARPRERGLDPGEFLAPLEQRDSRHRGGLHLRRE